MSLLLHHCTRNITGRPESSDGASRIDGPASQTAHAAARRERADGAGARTRLVSPALIALRAQQPPHPTSRRGDCFLLQKTSFRTFSLFSTQ